MTSPTAGLLDMIANAAASLAPVDDPNASSNMTRGISNEHMTQDHSLPPLLRESSISSTSSSSGGSYSGSVLTDKEVTDDETNAPNNTSGKQTTQGNTDNKYLPFPVVLMQLLQDKTHSDVISFRPDGRSFVITDRKTFASTVMPKIFHLKRLDTFLKKLKRWGFQSLSEVSPNDSSDSYVFFHTEDRFRAGNIALCRRIRRRQANEVEDCNEETTSQKRRMLLQRRMRGASAPSEFSGPISIARRPSQGQEGFLCSNPLSTPVPISEAELHAATNNIVGAAVEALMRENVPKNVHRSSSSLLSMPAMSRGQLRLSGLTVRSAMPRIPAANDTGASILGLINSRRVLVGSSYFS